MRYTLLLHYPEQTGESIGEDVIAEGQKAFTAYAAALHGAGILVSAEVLRPTESTTTLTTVDGELRVQDGPFADTKEQLGGSFVIDVADLDAAISWARQAPPVQWGAVEIRPGATHTREGVWVPNV